MPGRLDFELGFGPSGRRRDEAEPMRLLVIGDFSAAPAAERPPLADRPTHRVDLDTVEAVMRRLAPRVRLASGAIQFEQIDDFHPDRLYARLDAFDALRKARANPPMESDDVLGRLLGKPPEPRTAPAAAPPSGIDALIRQVVAPHVVADQSPQVKSSLAAVEAASAEQMRAVLHAEPFQQLEAAWRGVQWLVSSLELDDALQLHLFDVTRDELLADIVGARGALEQTSLHRALAARSRGIPGGHGWSALAALMDFGPSDQDVGLLAALGLIASQAGGPLLAGARDTLAREDPAPEGWQALRRSEAAPWIALAAPRVLLRRPYGKGSDPIDSFAFEEFAGPPAHEALLWGHASLALALLIGRGFMARGWDMEPGDEREIGELPGYTFARDGELEMLPCAERFLTEREIQRMLQAGLIPIASRRDRHAVVAIELQSIADTA